MDVAGEAARRGRRDISEAVRFLRGSPLVAWSLVYVALTYMLIAIAGALAPGYVREVLLLPERSVVLLVAPAGIGVVVGLGVLNAVSARIGHSHLVGLGLGICSGALLVLVGVINGEVPSNVLPSLSVAVAWND